MIVWREKFRALLLHFLVTAAVAAVAAAVIFFVWFPDPFQAMMGGTKLFLLISICDLVLGPLISLVIYNSKKSRRELITDYSIVGAVQLAAFVYGVLSIANARPVYVAFVGDRFEVVRADDLTDENLQAGKDPYRTRPKWGPELIATQMPTDVKERNDVLFAGLGGNDIQTLPRYYVSYETAKEQIKQRAQPMEALYKRHPEAKQLVQDAKLAVPESELRWLPIRARSFWTVLLDANGGPPLAYLPLDPYDS
jgi:hypothetical protein